MGLPWTIQVAAANPAAVGQIDASRRRLMSAGFLLILLVIGTAGYFVFRSVNGELGVARLQSEFVAVVSHEFRTPLTAMRHLTEMLEEGGTAPDRLPLYFRALGKETRRLHGMVESLLDFGRMEAGRRAYRMEGANAVELAREIVDEFREQPSAASRRLELQAAASPPLQIRADRGALALALRNLLDNAVKYSPEESTVRVSVESRKGFAGISVQDQGAGIPKEEQREVFRKFARGSSAREMNVKGTGIGLTMAYEIVKAHGGRLELASEPGCGSCFTILLPLHEGRA
jgi:two-component system phosphate regulon sensor histidine kinase PhoR